MTDSAKLTIALVLLAIIAFIYAFNSARAGTKRSKDTKMKIMRKMSGKGDECVAEWNETTSPEELAKIEVEFKEMTKNGYFAADIDKGELIKEFDPQANILLMPHMQGG